LRVASHVAHHYVPRFLLEQWHAPPDQKLTSFRWAADRLLSHRYKAKSVAKERHLYSMGRSRPTPDVKVERDFWGPHIDDPAAVVHAKMLGGGVTGLSLDDRKAWSAFLISLILRGPTMVRQIRERGREILAAGLDKDPHEFLEARGDEPEATLREWVEKHLPDVLDDLGVMALPKLAFSEKLNLALLHATWGIRAVRSARFDLLIGDKPVIVAGTFERAFLLALPISPSKAFFALNSRGILENLRKHGHDKFVKAMNTSTVEAAERHVFATSTLQQPFVHKLLRVLTV